MSTTAALEAMVRRFADAIERGDRARIKRMYADDIVSCDAVPPLRNIGREVVDGRLDAWMDEYDGPMGCEIEFGGGDVEGRLAYCHFLERITGRTPAGASVDMWVRVTWCLTATADARDDDGWRIVHQHMSDPFDPASGRARLDLVP